METITLYADRIEREVGDLLAIEFLVQDFSSPLPPVSDSISFDGSGMARARVSGNVVSISDDDLLEVWFRDAAGIKRRRSARLDPLQSTLFA